MYAWRDTNYFSPLADQKPLLHTWSLGVEEQFYIFFPLVLWLLARRWPRLVLPAIILTTVGSFALDVLAQRAGANTFAFFSLPTRAWELGIGAIVALAPQRKPAWPQWQSLAFARRAAGTRADRRGTVLSELFPSPIPDPGARRARHRVDREDRPVERTPASRLLAFRRWCGSGLISYSLYLWHWPVIVFSKYWLVRELQPIEIAAAWAFMFLAAWLSWRYVERPFRSREFPVRRLYPGSAVGTTALVAVGLVLLQSRGLPVAVERRCRTDQRGRGYSLPLRAQGIPEDRAHARLRDEPAFRQSPGCAGGAVGQFACADVRAGLARDPRGARRDRFAGAARFAACPRSAPISTPVACAGRR